MRIIFLDVDGVLNGVDFGRFWCVRLPYEGDGVGTLAAFNGTCVARFNRLVERTGANVVLSRTWGRPFGFEPLCRYVASQGVDCNVIGRTSVAETCRPRGADIQCWLDGWSGEEIESLCILDDHADMLHLSARLVRIDRLAGLQDADVERAVTMLVGDCA